MINTYDSDQLEEFIVQENEILRKCVDLLNRKVLLSDWSQDVRDAFLLAIQAGDGREAYKAFSVARHLNIDRRFLGYDAPASPSPSNRRCSERIRADLPGLVKLGAGRYLISGNPPENYIDNHD